MHRSKSTRAMEGVAPGGLAPPAVEELVRKVMQSGHGMVALQVA